MKFTRNENNAASILPFRDMDAVFYAVIIHGVVKPFFVPLFMNYTFINLN
ncbi:hypothetical protein [Bacillus sp. E214]|nr:hypothetical protein [Bacillus sp. E214]